MLDLDLAILAARIGIVILAIIAAVVVGVVFLLRMAAGDQPVSHDLDRGPVT